jgi:queuine tRNA-ribosyltransferase
MNFFEIEKTDKKSRARAGKIRTAHGDFKTPVLMTVGTKAAIKGGVDSEFLKKIGGEVLLANTYHLHLNPGENLIAKFGGLHKFCGWDGPIFTDSGGFQIFSMGHGTVSDEIKGKGMRHKKRTLLQISERGAKFKSYRDGAEKFLTPESSMEIQFKLNSDLIAAFDECTPFHAGKFYTENSMHRTHRWLDRCVAELKKLKSRQNLFSIIQGGIWPDLRKISCEVCGNSETPGICIGGSLGDSKLKMMEIVDFCTANLPREKPVHLLGIGDFPDLISAINFGVDSFDCVAPTRDARHGSLFCRGEKKWRISISNSKFKNDAGPIDPNCDCEVCRKYSRAFLRYLFSAGETLAVNLATRHNIFFVQNFVREIRTAILAGKFKEFAENFWREFN